MRGFVLSSFVAGLVLSSWAAHAAAQDESPIAIAPTAQDAFVLATAEGRLRRYDAKGTLLEEITAPSKDVHFVRRIEVVANGFVIAARDVLRASKSSSETLISHNALRAEGCDRISDFAMARDGQRGVVLSNDYGAPGAVVLAWDGGKLRRLASSKIERPAHVAIDEKARWVALLFNAPPGSPGTFHAGPLVVYDFSTGKQLWEAPLCDGPLYGHVLQFEGSSLVTCAPGTKGLPISMALASYDASSGKIRWKRNVASVFARAFDGTLFLQEDNKAALLDPNTGKVKPFDFDAASGPIEGVLVGQTHVANLVANSVQPKIVEIAKAPWARRAP
jgi:hypothetical protein